MPNTQSAIRRTERTKAQTSVNKSRKGKYKSAIKQMYNYIDSGKMKEAKNYLPKFHSQLMKIAKTGVINKKNFQNYKKNSKSTKKIN